VVMLEELCVDDLKDKVSLFQDKVEDQIGKLANIREKVSSIKENYDKKFNDLENHFKEIETLFLTNYFEQQTLGDIKNSKQKQKDIIGKITSVLEDLDKLKREVTFLKNNQSDFDFYNFEGIRTSLE
jgi:archaellum component FlaC